MRLKSITLVNIKSFRDSTTVMFNDSLNILVGPNGGGKSNLLDTITVVLRHFFLKGWSFETHSDELGSYNRILESDLFANVHAHLPPFSGHVGPQSIAITFAIRQQEIDAMKALNSLLPTLERYLKRYRNHAQHGNAIVPLQPQLFKAGESLTYYIENGALVEDMSDAAKEYLVQLGYHELHTMLARDAGVTLAAQFLYFSPFRGAASPASFEANLSATNESATRTSYLQATSRLNTSLIELATLHFGAKRLRLEKESSDEGFQGRWDADSEVRAVKAYLKQVGYAWSLQVVSLRKNIYRILLERHGQRFDIAQASTGEQELINYLFGLFGFGLNGGLLLIDEVELHLHPKWQGLLLGLLTELTAATDNQVFASTHSPAFITPQSVKSVTRVFRDATQASRTSRVEGDEANVRDMLHVVNSHNNERMFFADRVVLVEGIMDRLLFQRLVEREADERKSTEIVEVLEVHGKGQFPRYISFLKSFGVAVFVVADLDYCLNIGKQAVGSLFITEWSAIEQRTLQSKKSVDRETLAEALEEAINTNDLAYVRDLWGYIKSRHVRLKPVLTSEDQVVLNAFVDAERRKGTFILRQGEIEAYLPTGHKNVMGVVALTAVGVLERWLEETATSAGTRELLSIASAVCATT